MFSILLSQLSVSHSHTIISMESPSPQIKKQYPFFVSFFIFWCRPFLKSLLNLLQYCFCFMFWFFGLQGMWNLRSLIRDWTWTPCIGRWTPNHWTSREIPGLGILVHCFPQTPLCKKTLVIYWPWTCII